MEDRVKAFWADKSKEDIDRAFERAMTILMLLEFAFTIGIYMLLKAFVPMIWAETWLVAMYAFTVKAYVDLSSPILKKKLLKRIGREEDEEDKEDIKPEDSIE